MAKKTRQSPTEPSPGAVPSRDVLQRLNYLYQASTFLAAALAPPARTLSTSAAPTDPSFLIPTQAGGLAPAERGEVVEDVQPEASTSAASPPRVQEGSVVPDEKEWGKGKGKSRGKEGLEGTCAPPVSRMMIKTMREVAKKAVLRMDPTVKRTMCKGCSAVLVPGVTCTVRIKPSGPHGHRIITTCLACNHHLRLPAPPHLPPESAAPSPTTEAMDVEPGKSERVGREANKWERKKRRQARKPTFFEREGHVTFAADVKVER